MNRRGPAIVWVEGSSLSDVKSRCAPMPDFQFRRIDGQSLCLNDFAGRPVLVVNTASSCRFTFQYAELQALWQQYRDRGLVVLGVPCNDFGGQEPGTETEIQDFCRTRFGVDFPLCAKHPVAGEQAHAFYRWVVAEGGDAAAPKWNFHKYLVAPDGSLAGAWPPEVSVLDDDVSLTIRKHLPPDGPPTDGARTGGARTGAPAAA